MRRREGESAERRRTSVQTAVRGEWGVRVARLAGPSAPRTSHVVDHVARVAARARSANIFVLAFRLSMRDVLEVYVFLR